MLGETHRLPTGNRYGTNATLYCRSLVPNGILEAYASHLRRLHHDGQLDGMALHWWPRQIPVEPEPIEPDLRTQFDRIQAWAARAGVVLSPAFERKTIECSFTGTVRTVVATPHVGLIVERDGELIGVYPHTRDETLVTVKDGLSDLRSRLEEDESRLDSSPSVVENRCPRCGGPIGNVQGVRACLGCDWLEMLPTPTVEPHQKPDRATVVGR